jgi:putative selenate reductase
MAELVPSPFRDLVTRLRREPQVQETLFGLPQTRWYQPDPAVPDLGVSFHGRHAGTPVGPAAGPHTQMAQNLLLCYAAGARILELKTVQVNDRLTIPRPCIDMAGAGYNVEWSQELTTEESAREYVAGAMLIEMFRHGEWGAANGLDRAAGDVIYDVSVGYDLRGIQSDKVCRFLDAMRDAGEIVERLRAEIPAGCAKERDLAYPTELSTSITLSTFHGCPADEIERIAEFLLGEKGFDVCVKLNPPMLGRDRLEHLLHEVMGYRDIEVHPQAYTSGLPFQHAVELCRRLMSFAERRGRRFGVKLCNTLEVRNHRSFFPADCNVMYLSGQPLYVIVMTLADTLRQAIGMDLPMSYSGGIDKWNFPDAVAGGFVPVTVCTDLLRAGGYGRLPAYLQRLADEMRQVSAKDIDTFIRNRGGDGATAESTAAAAQRNLAQAAERARTEDRYQAAVVHKQPKRLDSALKTFDCISCDKCIPVCPNAAIFTYPTPPGTLTYRDIVIEPSGRWQPADVEVTFAIREERQIAFHADSCNECGNCDTFCPEQGAPYRDKPGFFDSLDSWRRAAPRDGYVIEAGPSVRRIYARIGGRVYVLEMTGETKHRFRDGRVEVVLDTTKEDVVGVASVEALPGPHRVDLGVYHALKCLLAGVLDPQHTNPINIRSL